MHAGAWRLSDRVKRLPASGGKGRHQFVWSGCERERKALFFVVFFTDTVPQRHSL